MGSRQYEQVERDYFAEPIERHGVYVNAIYIHFKGKEYVIKDVVLDADTLEPVVVYDALYENKTSRGWSRKLANFVEILPDGRPRFQLKMEIKKSKI